MAARELPADPRHAWLPAVLPAGARRFRTAAADLAVALTVAEAELVDDRPDVDIVHDEAEAPDAPVAIVPLHEDPPGAHSRTARAVQLAARSIALRRRAAVIALRLRRLGYSNVRVLLWQENEPLPASTRTGSLRSLLPLGALVVAERQEPRVTALQAAASTAGFRLARSPVVRQALVVAEDDRAILRVAIGPAGRQIDAAAAALSLLRAADPPDDLAARIPWLVADGREGLARWSLEPRLRGRSPARGRVPVADCIEFLAALFNCRADGPGRGPTDDAQLVSEFDPRAETIAARAAAELAGLPVGFGHGDFWAQNLLVDNGCLTGVVDWDAAGPGRLPLIDLLHLTMSREQARRRLASVGETIVSVLLPWARRGGDEQARSLFRRLVGGDADPVVLEALVCVYWLGYVAYQIRLYRDRSEPKWLEPNVLMVADALAV